MGTCFSSCTNLNNHTSNNNSSFSGSLQTTAKVITIEGILEEHSVPITAGDALIISSTETSSFICCSDSLFMDEPIQAMKTDQTLREGQIYFILSNSKLHKILSGAEMAALATKASSALSTAALASPRSSSNERARNRIIRVRPVAEVDENMCQILNENSCGHGKAWRSPMRVASLSPPSSPLSNFGKKARKKGEVWTRAVLRKSFRGNRLSTIDEIIDA